MNLDDLKKRIAEERSTWNDIGRYKFRIERPTGIEAMRLIDSLKEDTGTTVERSLRTIEQCMQYVKAWDGVCERDFLTDGSMTPVSFDAEMLRVFVSEHVDVGDDIAGRVFELINDKNKKDAEEKKS